MLQATDQIVDAEGYRSLVVAYPNGAPIHLRDVGAVIEAAEDTKAAGWLQDKRGIGIDVHKQPGFNVVHTVEQVKERLPALIASLPPAAKLRIVSDRTQTIQASVHGVEFTRDSLLRDARAQRCAVAGRQTREETPREA